MNDLQERTIPAQEGWSIHIYNGNRHLLCTVGPSHGWAFGLGILTGGLMLLTFSNLRWPSSTNISTPDTTPSNSLPSPETTDSSSLKPSIFWFE
ncbi:MAG: hypothetical protein AAFP20_02360 [Cyanobacteria bacterium J06614_10]